MRENMLRAMACQAARDPNFLRQVRQNHESTLARHGYRLTHEEMRLVENLRRRTASITDEELVRTLVNGLEGRTGNLPAPPAVPSWRGSDPGRPAPPGG